MRIQATPPSNLIQVLLLARTAGPGPFTAVHAEFRRREEKFERERERRTANAVHVHVYYGSFESRISYPSACPSANYLVIAPKVRLSSLYLVRVT